MPTSRAAIILAAGVGSRMRSRLPKVLHPCCDVPLVAHVVHLALQMKCDPIVVVVNAHGDAVRQALISRFPKAPLEFAVQTEQKGTGHAVQAGLGVLKKAQGMVCVLSGDVPLLRLQTLQKLCTEADGHDVALLSATLKDPTGYGRIVHGEGTTLSIVEHKDATQAQRDIHTVNVGVYAFDLNFLSKALKKITPHNAQGEYYLTDVVGKAAQAIDVHLHDPREGQGINTKRELQHVEDILRRRILEHWMDQGVTIEDMDQTFVGADVVLDSDVVLGRGGVRVHGHSHIQEGAIIEGPAILRDTVIHPHAHVYGFSHIEHANIGASASVGPFARLRTGSVLHAESKVGNFVELKNTTLGTHSKANHLAYLGDATIAEESNIGAGTITCNYDGVSKYKTTVGSRCFVGSNSTLVAPVSLGDGAYVAAGSTITQSVSSDALAFGRSRQVNREGDAKRLRAIQAKRKKE